MNKGPLRLPATLFWIALVVMDGASGFLEWCGWAILTTLLVTPSL